MEIIPDKNADLSKKASSPESMLADPDAQELKSLISQENFANDYLAVQTRRERIAILKIKEKDTQYAEKMALARGNLDTARGIHLRYLEKLKIDLENPSAELVQALKAWARSRNVKGDTGPEQKGFNSGVVHYFEYRTHVKKNKKHFKPENILSIDGFIEHTRTYEGFLLNPSPANNQQVEMARLLEDSVGNRRLYVLTKEGDFVVGFQKVGEQMKILSVYFYQNSSKIEKTVNEALNPTNISKTRFNRLEGQVREINL